MVRSLAGGVNQDTLIDGRLDLILLTWVPTYGYPIGSRQPVDEKSLSLALALVVSQSLMGIIESFVSRVSPNMTYLLGTYLIWPRYREQRGREEWLPLITLYTSVLCGTVRDTKRRGSLRGISYLTCPGVLKSTY